MRAHSLSVFVLVHVGANSFSEKMVVKRLIESLKSLDPAAGTLVSIVPGFVEQTE